MAFRFVKISGFYKSYLEYYYKKNPDIKNLDYNEQYKDLMNQGYGYSDYFHRHFVKHDVEGWEIVYNATPLQRAWAKEHNSVRIGESLILEQLMNFKPDVVFFQDSISFSPNLISSIRKEVKSVRQIIGMCCSPISPEILGNYKLFDYMLGCSPYFNLLFDKAGLKNYEFYHCFENNVLKSLPPKNEKREDLIFIGSFIEGKEFHTERNQIISELVQDEKIKLKIFGNINTDSSKVVILKQMIFGLVTFLKLLKLNNLLKRIPVVKKFAMMNKKPVQSNFSKNFISKVNTTPIFGFEMYNHLQSAKIGFNMHAGIAGEYAANVRMFEVTGVGSLLLTDHKKNITKLFEPDKEIVTYNSISECIEKVNWLLANPEKLNEIAIAGQRRTLRDHSVEKRVDYLNDIIKSNFN